MTNYFSPTVVWPKIPAASLTAIELFVLEQVFDLEEDGEDLYAARYESPGSILSIKASELREFAGDPVSSSSPLFKTIADQCPGYESISEGDDESQYEIDVEEADWLAILQEVIRRAPNIDHFSVTTSFVCDKMRPDGFGGCITLVTADLIDSMGTEQMLEKMKQEHLPAPEAESQPSP